MSKPGPFTQLVIEDIDLVKPVPDSIYAMDFPEPRVLVDATTLLRHAERTTWNVVKLPGPGERGTIRLPTAEAYLESPKMPGVHTARAGWPRWIGIAAVLAILVSITVVVRRIRRG